MSPLRRFFGSWGPMLFLVPILVSCSGGDSEPMLQEEVAVNIEVTSPAFTEGATIPVEHTCDGEDISPPLKWKALPDNTKSIALISDDPDAPGGTWVHWVLYAIPPDVTEFPAGVLRSQVLSNGARQGKNDFNRLGYGGPCPPKGSPHRYFFKVYALDIEVDLVPGATKSELLQSIDGHILAQGQLMGRYQRR